MELKDYELLFDLSEGTYEKSGIKGIRTVTIRAGRSLEVMCHPNIVKWPDAAKRAAKERRTGEAMAKLNARNLQLKVMRLAEINFGHLKAMVLTGTYEYPWPGEDDPGMINMDDLWRQYAKEGLPECVEDVRKDVRKFLQRIRRKMRRVGSDPKALKWMLRIEENAKMSDLGFPPRYHIHMLIEADGLNQDDVSAEWPFGFTRCDRFDLLRDGAARIAKYLTKNKRGGRSFSHSRNLKKPVEKVSDRKVSRRRAAAIAVDVLHDGRRIFEQLYPGYMVMETPRVHYSDFMPGAYIYCRMRRRD